MLLAYRVVAPACRAVELGDQRRLALDAYLIDAVLVAVQRQHAGIAEKAEAFHGIQHQIGGEGGKGMAHGGLQSMDVECTPCRCALARP
ncbi:hypothetical protein D9M73_236950 [compost metagenome]